MSEPHTIVNEKDLTFAPVVDATERCPRCLSNWVGDPIPEQNRHLYGKHTHFSKLIGVEIPGRYDGVHHWMCPQCRTTFPRWYESYDGKPTRRMFEDNLHETMMSMGTRLVDSVSQI